MFDRMPETSERRSWSWVVAWSLTIFAAVPLARGVQVWVRESLGEAAFAWFAIGFVGVAVVAAARARVRARPPGGSAEHGPLLWLLAVAAVFVAATASLWSNPEEAMHFVQYGVLSLLLHRALAHRLRDRSIYLTATLGCVFVGGLEEVLQWFTPDRYFGLRDVALDGLGGALAQIGLAKGIAPPYVSPTFEPRGLRVLVRTALLVWSLLFACVLNTPSRVDFYAARIDALSHLATNPSVMMEYGYRYSAPRIGVFRSRLAPAALERADRERGASLGRFVAENRQDYDEFLARHPAQRDPYAHEFRVHLFRRDYHARVLEENPQDPFRQWRSLAVVREDRLLRRYFPEAFRAGQLALDPALQREFESRSEDSDRYESQVSKGLVTELREWQLIFGFVAGYVALVGALRRLGAG